MAVRVNGTATVPASLQNDITTIRNNVATILSRVTGSVALDADMQTLLARLTATRAGNLDNLAGGAVATAASLAVSTGETTDNSLTSGINNAYSAYTELDASLAAQSQSLCFSGSILSSLIGGIDTVQFATGAGGNETPFASARVQTNDAHSMAFTVISKRKFAAGTRISVRARASAANTSSVNVGVTVDEL